MWSLFKKEINSFLSSLIGYITIVVFLLINGLFLWVISSSSWSFNIFDSTIASIDGLFALSPWLCLLLNSAITMKMFAEEKKNGTIEILLTKPISDISIITAKFLAGLIIVILSVLPTMIYIICVYSLGSPTGNIDLGSCFGSYIGLIFLGGVFVSIGIFASSITDNQILSFIASLILCFLFYIGFTFISWIPFLSKIDLGIRNLGIEYHYMSMSRGVISLRDVIYFLSVTAFFIFLTRVTLPVASRISVKITYVIQLFVCLGVILVLNIAVYFLFRGEIDLTKEKRYSLTDATKQLLTGDKSSNVKIEDNLTIRCYLGNDIPVQYKELRNSLMEKLNEFRNYNSKIQYDFTDPNTYEGEQKAEFYQKLFKLGFQPLLIQTSNKGKAEQQYIFPYVEVSYKGRTTFNSIMNTSMGFSEQMLIQSSIQNLEYILYSSINTVVRNAKPSIAFLYGQGEIDAAGLLDIIQSLDSRYLVDSLSINGKIDALVERKYKEDNSIDFHVKYPCIVIAKPQTPFTAKDLYILDQYIMRGGKVLWLAEPLSADMDSLQNQASTLALSVSTGAEDMLFNYGVKLNSNLIMDLQCVQVPIVTGTYGNGRPQMTFYPWNFFAQLSANPNTIIAQRINPVKVEFASTIDSVENNGELKFTPILETSENTRLLNAPVNVSLQMLKQKQDARLFNQGKHTVAMLIEGKFSSFFRNRLPEEMMQNPMIANLNSSDSTAMIVIADGDIIKNDWKQGQVVPLGYDIYTNQMFGNKDFLINCIDYLCGNKEIIPLRDREFVVRRLDMAKIDREKTGWQLFNILIPLGIISLICSMMMVIRRKRFAK
ncbi:MAG: gliding motility-associated ABC transporter substrate-binding protein GldG [Bacteroidales bacterium]|nr:gliding motility-associated ABC transporter substrate-binding protein GldG [Bacteroidales bacterium]